MQAQKGGPSRGFRERMIMAKPSWYRSLSLKLILWVGVITVIVSGVFAYVNLHGQQKQLVDEAIVGAKQLSATLTRSLRFDMLHNYREALYNSIENIGAQEGIEKIRIFNKEGAIMFSSDKEEMGQLVDKNAEACYRSEERRVGK